MRSSSEPFSGEPFSGEPLSGPLTARSPRDRTPWSARGRRYTAALWLGVLLLTASAAAAPRHRGSEGAFETADTSWEGTSQLVALAIERLGRERVRVTATLDYGELTPSDGVLILHPEVDLAFEPMSRFLRSGGRLTLLDDYGRGAAMLQRFGIRRIAPPSRPLQALRGQPGLAIAMPTVEMVAGVERGRHPITAHVEQVVTNHPTGLEHPQLTSVLEIPTADGAPVPLAVTGIIGNRGRLLAVGDPSIFINLMIRYPGNRAFAEGVIDYLVADDDWGPRRGKLFVLANHFNQTGHFGDEEHWLDELEQRIRDVSAELKLWREDGVPDRVAWGLAWLSALACGAWLMAHAARTYRPILPRFARPVPAAAQGGVAGRASVLAAPSTAGALPLLELKVALQEILGQRLQPAGPVPLDQLPRRCREAGFLSAQDCDLVQKLAGRLRQVEQSVVRGAPLKIREAELLRLHEDILGLIQRASSSSQETQP